jgi:hypothetical protein
MQSDVDLVVEYSKALENLLRVRWDAEGRGLGALLAAVPESQLPPWLRREIHAIARIRNEVVHQTQRLNDRTGFVKRCSAALEGLICLVEKRDRARKKEDVEAAFGIPLPLADPTTVQEPLPVVTRPTETEAERAHRMADLRLAVRQRIQSDPYDPRISSAEADSQ